MNCPVCGMETNGAMYCPSCGANMSAFEGVSQDKVIVNQTPAQQMAAGDDSVTQLIPENYMNASGDDSVTQLIPENYMTSTGDDNATVMLDPNLTAQEMPNQQPQFSQGPAGIYQQPQFNQQQGMAVQPGYQQAYQPNYGQPVSYGGAIKQSPAVSKVFSLASLVIMLALLISCVVLMTKPLYYITQSYVGGVMSGEELEEEVVGQDEDDYQDANNSARIFVVAVMIFVIIGAINAWVCFMRIKTNCIKSPVNKAVGAFVLGLFGSAIFIILKTMLDEVISDGLNYGGFTPQEAAMFNVYSLAFVLCIVSAIVNLVNIFTSSMAKTATR